MATRVFFIAFSLSRILLSGYAFIPSNISLKARDLNTPECTVMMKAICGKGLSMGRDEALKRMVSAPLLSLAFLTPGAHMAEAKISVKPGAAFENLVKAREELALASEKYLTKKDYEGMREYFADESLNINNYEDNANVLLSSKQLDAESKKEIGTIRRYGVGADVIIMYGGLKGEIDEENDAPNYSAVSKSLQRTMQSLDEVITICRSNGF
jgi:hypothetical protein